MFNAALFGFSCVIIKKMSKIHHSVILFYMGFGLLLSSCLAYPYNLRLHQLQEGEKLDNNKEPLHLGVYAGGFFLSGLIFALGQLSEMYALKICTETGRVIIMENFTALIAYIISVGIFGESVNLMCLVGGITAIVGVIKTIK